MTDAVAEAVAKLLAVGLAVVVEDAEGVGSDVSVAVGETVPVGEIDGGTDGDRAGVEEGEADGETDTDGVEVAELVGVPLEVVGEALIVAVIDLVAVALAGAFVWVAVALSVREAVGVGDGDNVTVAVVDRVAVTLAVRVEVGVDDGGI